MDTAQALATAEELLKPYARVVDRPSPDRLDVTILPTALEAAARAIKETQWGYLSAITGLDRPGTSAPSSDEKQWSHLGGGTEDDAVSPGHEGSIEVLYHFCRKAAILTIRTSVRYSFPVLPTICEILPAATLYERELAEMFGVKIVGTPNKDRLLLPDDWPDGIYPLRKSFKGLETNPSAQEA